MLSDYYRFFKIGLAMAAVILFGSYYNMNRPEAFSDLGYYYMGIDKNSHRFVCFSNVKIDREEGQFLAVTRNGKIPLLDLPQYVQLDYTGDFAIKGSFSDKNQFLVERVRRKYSRLLKITSSIITALIVCPLIFVFFRVSKKGFLPKNENA